MLHLARGLLLPYLIIRFQKRNTKINQFHNFGPNRLYAGQIYIGLSEKH